LFLFYDIVGILYTTVLHVIGLVTSVKDADNSIGTIIVQVLALAFLVPFGIGLLPLFVSQVQSVVYNETTLEEMINFRIRQHVKGFRNPYDVGLLRNVRAFLGDHVLLWLVPTVPPRSREAGVSFPLRAEASPA